MDGAFEKGQSVQKYAGVPRLLCIVDDFFCQELTQTFSSEFWLHIKPFQLTAFIIDPAHTDTACRPGISKDKVKSPARRAVFFFEVFDLIIIILDSKIYALFIL